MVAGGGSQVSAAGARPAFCFFQGALGFRVSAVKRRREVLSDGASMAMTADYRQ
jgi:hypothetical protein